MAPHLADTHDPGLPQQGKQNFRDLLFQMELSQQNEMETRLQMLLSAIVELWVEVLTHDNF